MRHEFMFGLRDPLKQVCEGQTIQCNRQLCFFANVSSTNTAGYHDNWAPRDI